MSLTLLFIFRLFPSHAAESCFASSILHHNHPCELRQLTRCKDDKIKCDQVTESTTTATIFPTLLARKQHCVLFSKSYNTNDGEGTDSQEGRSIGEVVRGLHGGKYQFDRSAHLAGYSYEGQQFAHSLYADTLPSEKVGADEGNSEQLPKWALRLQNLDELNEDEVIDTLQFCNYCRDGNQQPIQQQVVQIQNDERSWEKYYAFLLPSSSVISGNNISCPFIFRSSSSGMLAPRGGASNVCDPDKPYSDCATIAIDLVMHTISYNAHDYWRLVIGTEAKTWQYALQISQ